MKIFVLGLLVLGLALTQSTPITKKIDKRNTDSPKTEAGKLEKPKDSSKFSNSKIESPKITPPNAESSQLDKLKIEEGKDEKKDNLELEDASDQKQVDREKKSCKTLTQPFQPAKVCMEVVRSPSTITVCDDENYISSYGSGTRPQIRPQIQSTTQSQMPYENFLYNIPQSQSLLYQQPTNPLELLIEGGPQQINIPSYISNQGYGLNYNQMPNSYLSQLYGGSGLGYGSGNMVLPGIQGSYSMGGRPGISNIYCPPGGYSFNRPTGQVISGLQSGGYGGLYSGLQGGPCTCTCSPSLLSGSSLISLNRNADESSSRNSILQTSLSSPTFRSKVLLPGTSLHGHGLLHSSHSSRSGLARLRDPSSSDGPLSGFSARLSSPILDSTVGVGVGLGRPSISGDILMQESEGQIQYPPNFSQNREEPAQSMDVWGPLTIQGNRYSRGPDDNLHEDHSTESKKNSQSQTSPNQASSSSIFTLNTSKNSSPQIHPKTEKINIDDDMMRYQIQSPSVQQYMIDRARQMNTMGGRYDEMDLISN